MQFARLAFAVCILVVLDKASALADATADAAAIKAVFETPKIDASAFTAAFAEQVPLDGVQSFVDTYKQHLGAPTSYVFDGFQYKITSPKGSIVCNIALDQSGKISSLLFHDEMSADDLAALQKVMAATKADAAWFEESFAHDVPIARVDDVIRGLHTKYGKFVRIEARKKGYFTIFERGVEHAQISVTASDKIDYLAFSEP